MNRDVPALDIGERSVTTTIETDIETVTEQLRQAAIPIVAPPLANGSFDTIDGLPQANQLEASAKVALICKLMAQLEPSHIQTIIEFGLREIGEQHRQATSPALTHHQTRLLLKKDYSYQDRGLSEPTQYYVYLRRRKPKLDRYIGTLFYVPQGCLLDYRMDEAGRILFNPPHNLFQLKDSTNPTASQWVRLVGLEPPPPDYTFDKQAHDTPDIRLLVEYLDPQTHQAIARQSYPFPGCMYEGGKLDRYRWEVSTIPLPPPDKGLPPVPAPALASAIEVKPVEPLPEPVSVAPTRRVLELPVTKALTFPLANPADSEAVLKRMRLWAAWSEKAMPQSRWEMIQDGAGYTLMNAHFKRRILKFSSTQATITLENSLPVIAKWFHDLGLAVSQAQNQRQYSAVQLKLAHSLFIDMSLPQTDPVVMLRKLFGVEFSRP